MVHIFSPLARIVKAGSSFFLWSSRLGLSSSFRRWNEYSQSTTVNPSTTSHGTPEWTHTTPLAVALRPAPKTILCSFGTHLSAMFKVATTVITGWGSCLWPRVKEIPGLQYLIDVSWWLIQASISLSRRWACRDCLPDELLINNQLTTSP